MKARPKKRSNNYVLRFIVLLLLASGLVRLGTVGEAIARQASEGDGEQKVISEGSDRDDPVLESDLDGLLELVQARNQELDAREQKLDERQRELSEAEDAIKESLVRLEQAESELASTIAQVDGASEKDLVRLTKVYESMKPKTASALFEQMNPDFAAGFLGRMVPGAAAAIMSGLSSEKAYAVSVVLAGRNALAPKE